MKHKNNSTAITYSISVRQFSRKKVRRFKGKSVLFTGSGLG